MAGVDTKQTKLSKYIREWRSISQLLLGSHVPNLVWRFLRHIETFPDHLGGVHTLVDSVLVPKTRPS